MLHACMVAWLPGKTLTSSGMEHVSEADEPSGTKVPIFALGSLLIRAVRAGESCCCCCGCRCSSLCTASRRVCAGSTDGLRSAGRVLAGVFSGTAVGVAFGVAAGLSSTFPDVYDAPLVLLPASNTAPGELLPSASWLSGILSTTGSVGAAPSVLLLGLGMGLAVLLGSESPGRGGSCAALEVSGRLLEGDSVFSRSREPCQPTLAVQKITGGCFTSA